MFTDKVTHTQTDRQTHTQTDKSDHNTPSHFMWRGNYDKVIKKKLDKNDIKVRFQHFLSILKELLQF